MNKISRGNLANLKEILPISQSKFFLANKINFTKNIVKNLTIFIFKYSYNNKTHKFLIDNFLFFY